MEGGGGGGGEGINSVSVRERERVCVPSDEVVCYFINNKGGTRFHRHCITDVKTNLAPLKGLKGNFCDAPPASTPPALTHR